MSTMFLNIDGKRYRKKVRAIIVNSKSEFLLIRPHGYKEDTWTFVGGGVEEGENVLEAVLREIREEIGVDQTQSIEQSTIDHRFEFSDAIKSKRGLDYDGQAATIFFVKIDHSMKISLQNDEIAAFTWARLSEVRHLVKVESQYLLFEKVLSELSGSSAA